MLPEQFIAQLTLSLGPERAGEVLYFIQNTAPSVAVRLNPFKMPSADMSADQAVCDALSWLPVDRARRTFSQWGSFLETRPEFYLDPLFHAGTYYVQEASSMYLERIFPIMRQMREDRPSGAFAVLDLCAAPGGKTTHLLSMLRDIPTSFLVSNEVIRTRAAVLCENVSKWGAANVVVTNNDPADFAALPGYFDVMVVDAPCSVRPVSAGFCRTCFRLCVREGCWFIPLVPSITLRMRTMSHGWRLSTASRFWNSGISILEISGRGRAFSFRPCACLVQRLIVRPVLKETITVKNGTRGMADSFIGLLKVLAG